MAALPISTDGVSIFVQCKGYVYFEVTGAKSITISESANKHVVYDLSTYRDVLNAGELGRAWEVGAGFVVPFSSPGPPETTDDRPNHVAPREWMKPDTVIIWWDGALGTGNAIGQCRYSQFISYSNVRPNLMF
jgi:hypothetical protein